ncbi:hypothetical protein O3G_MSEX007437 [Manduca sexta]|uniref:Nin one binding (NOB1) Zn-ribbon-like domain-containing protein n=1 Tax=Manduca sexta TaxID=7130 RepID=A0A922CN55_MANSE|nr:hypothetical protein O3G_MSEX007437 [Manduca sexta]
MALTYQLEKEKVGTEHLKTEPTTQKIVKVTGLSNFDLHPENANKSEQKDRSNEDIKTEDSNTIAESSSQTELAYVESKNKVADVDNSNNKLSSEESVDNEETDDDKLAEQIAEQIKNMDLKDDKVDELMVKVSDQEDEDTESEEDSDSDGGEWITPRNLSEKKKELEEGEFEDKSAEVACITSDFAMQNVLKQIGLNVTAIDGRIIRQLRTFIFRCTTCFKTTSVMTKLFCPKCGHATLRKVGVSIDEEGNQHIHINGRKPLTARGKRFSLPTPKGGQHFQYPILTEDQHIHKRFVTKLARNKTNALDTDYIAGYSPFAMKDVNSKSAVLGVRANKQDVKYWMKNYSKGKK